MRDKLKGVLIATVVVAGLATGGAAIAGAGSGGDDGGEVDRAIGGSALDKASAAALDHTGGGRVTGTEVGDEESYYEVEVTRSGSQTDVQLDRDFNVVGQEADGANEDEGANDD